MVKRNNQPDHKIELDLLYPHSEQYRPHYCTFNFRGEFILYTKLNNTDDSSDKKIVWIYPTETNNDKWTCKKIYKVPENFELISVSKHDNQLYLFSNNYFYVWNMDTEKSTRIFINKNEKEEQMKDWNKVIKY